MKIGVSTSCFYPEETLRSLAMLQNAGIETVEVFLNSFSELEPEFQKRMMNQTAQSNTHICSLHPFSSGMETFFFASMYPLRMEDGIALYRKYFAFCEACGISIVVFHGDYRQTPFPFARHCENYARLREIAREYHVDFCQENVVRCKCSTSDYISKMRKILKDDVSFVLDIKQMRRANVALPDMLDAMHGKIAHIHLSDQTALCDCAVPGTGAFDFASFFQALKQQNFSGNAVIELYRGDFKDIGQLCEAARYLKKVAAACGMA